MPSINEVSDQYTLNLGVNDQMSGPVDAAAAKLDSFERQAEAAAEAIVGVGTATEQAGQKITTASTAWDRVSRKNDDLAAAMYRLKAAQEELTRTQEQASAALRAGTTDQDTVNRVLDEQTQKVNTASAALIEARDATEGMAEAYRLFNGALSGGRNQLDFFETDLRNVNQQIVGMQAPLTAFAAAAQAAFNKQLGVTGPTSDVDYAKRAADVAAYGASLDTLRAKIDPVFSRSKAYEAQLNLLNEALRIGEIQQGKYNALLDETNAAFATTQKTVQDVVISHGQATFAVRQLGVQTVQFFSSIEAGQSVLTAFIQQGHQVIDVALATGTGFGVLKDAAVAGWAAITTPTGLVIAGVTAVSLAVAGIGYAALNSYQQVAKLQTSLRATRTDYVSLSGEVEKAARSAAGSSTLSTSEARTAGQIIAAAPNFGGTQQQLSDLIKLSNDLSAVMGIKLPEAAKKLTDAYQDPAKAADELAKQHWPGMTQALVETISSMERAGDVAGATALVIATLGNNAAGAADKLSPVSAAMRQMAASGLTGYEMAGAGTYFSDQAQAAQAQRQPTAEEQAAAATAAQTARDALQQQTLTGARAIVDSTSTEQVQKYTNVLTALIKALDLYGERNALNAAEVDLLTAAISQVQKALEAAKPALDRQIEASQATADGQRQIAAAYANGTDAVVEATAHAKAYSEALALNLKPDTTDFTEALRRLIAENLNAANATATLKTAQDSLDFARQTELINAQTDALLLNTDAARRAIQAVKDKQALDKLPSDQRDAAAAGQAAVDAANLAKDEAARANKYLVSGNKPADIATARSDIEKLTADQAALGSRTDENATKWDQWSLAIKGAEDKLATLTKTHETHRAALLKQNDTLDAQIVAQGKLTAAWSDGGEAVLEVTARMKAEEQAIKDNLTPDTDKYRVAVEKLTEKHKTLAREVAETKAVEASQDTAAQIRLVEAETASLGENADARTLMIQHMKDQYDVQKTLVGLSPEEQAAALAQKDALAQVTLELNKQEAALTYASDQFSQAFDTIGTAITDTFTKGQSAAVDWGSVMRTVLNQVITLFARLAIINPLENMFGGNKTTLSTVLSLVGGGGAESSTASGFSSALRLVDLGNGTLGLSVGGTGGGGGLATIDGGFSGVGSATIDGGFSSGGTSLTGLASAVGGGRSSSSGGVSGILGIGSSLFSLGKAFFPDTFNLSGIGSSLGLTGEGGIFGGASSAISGVTDFLNTPVSFLGGEANIAGGYTTGLLGTSGSLTTVGSLIGGVGAGYGLGSLAGGFIQSSLGKVGPGPQIGAATGAIAGAVVGSVVPVIGTAVGAIIGGIIGGAGGGLIGPKAPSPYSSTYVGVDATTGLLNLGSTVSQGVDASSERSSTASWVTSTNSYLTALGLKISDVWGVNGPGRALSVQPGDLISFQIGQANKGADDPSKLNNTDQAFSSLSFYSPSNYLLNLGLSGRSFANPTELSGVVMSLSDFITALKGTPAESQTWQQMYKATSGVANADIQAALQPVATYITATVPNLLENVKGSLQQSLDSTNNQFNAAIATGTNYLGYGVSDLTSARDTITAKEVAQAYEATRQSDAQIANRLTTATAARTGNLPDQQAAALAAFDEQAKEQAVSLSQTLIATYGDAYAQTQSYADRMSALDVAQAAERLELTQQQTEALKQQAVAQQTTIDALTVAWQQAVANSTGSPADAQLAARTAYTANWTSQQAALRTTLLSQYGAAYEGTPGYNAQMKQFADTEALGQQTLLKSQNYTNWQTKLGSFNQDVDMWLRYSTAAASTSGNPQSVQNAKLAVFDQTAIEEQQKFQDTMRSTYGIAYLTSEEYATKLTALEKAQGAERLELQQQFNDQVTATASTTIVSLRDYARTLQFSASSPLSPASQYALAQSQFNAVAGSARAGDWTSIQNLQGYADTYLAAAKTMFGSGTDYVAAFNRVLDALQGVAANTPDTLTASILASETRTQTQALVDALEAIQTSVDALRDQMAQGSNKPDRLAA